MDSLYTTHTSVAFDFSLVFGSKHFVVRKWKCYLFFTPCFLLNPAVFHFSTVMMRQIGDAVGVDNDFFLIFVYVAREFVGIFA